MTKIKITKKDGHIIFLECDGHTGYGVEGEDIVCSALSSIVQTAVLGIVGVAGINATLKRKEGFLSLKIPFDITPEQKHDADIILNTMLCGVQDLYEGYSDFIELEVK
ncbi:MAG: ribosomal-processing cysteine protease Prp [Christensenellaceae bacterium]|jgi:uncharacterized protein YsxB (DUF464 family)|nr:ribosomal-processing cysteine protease Prp [Christensenellaceae bacterium]